MIKILNGHMTALLNPESQQLCSLTCKGREWMHGAALPKALQLPHDALGWKQSELIMFPIVGPVKDNLLQVRGVKYSMAQHGIARHLPWELTEHTNSLARFRQSYIAGTPVANSKIEAKLVWPFSYILEKTYELTESGIRFSVAVKNQGLERMHYNVGWHPAFRIDAPRFIGSFVDAERAVSLDEIRAASLKGALVLECRTLILLDSGVLRLTTDAPYIMLWSPDGSKMVCIEPTTQAPDWGGLSVQTGLPLEANQTRVHVTCIDTN